ncbi:hypothetical protein C437_01615 [Haloarcula vallismortis ATCC 29715]|uniref:Uncharacterized protein n=1 Tax=Haloarcula vallismortis ATCC 29715 TaxID=662477 RepID=M0JUD6_HALVA|nr:hypothetical protein C437_01615 [Haloarcula vallismortis ATCC 29715]
MVLATIYAPSGVEVSVSGGGTVEQFEGGAQALYTIDPTTGGTVGTSSIEVHYTGEVEDEMEVEIEGTAQLFPEGYRSQSEYHTDIGGMNQPIVILESTNPESNASQDQGVIDTVDDLTLSEKKIIFMIGMVFLFVLTSMIVTKL